MSISDERSVPSVVTHDVSATVAKPNNVPRDPVGLAAQHKLATSWYAGLLRGVRCESHEGVLILRGRVASYYLKQVAQTLVRDVDGVQVVVNRLDVVT